MVVYTLHITLLALLGSALVFFIIQLGLLGHAIALFNQVIEVPVYTDGDGYGYGFTITYETTKIGTPPIIAFLIFAAVWSVVVSAAAVGVPVCFHAKGKHGYNAWLAPALIGVYFVTWVFWIAGFVDLAVVVGDSLAGSPYINAIIAFGVLVW